MKVLIVEDDIDIRELISFFMEKEGYEVLEAGDGMTGLKLAKTYHPHIIILDLMLPNLDGKSLAQMIKKSEEKYGNPKIIMLTAKTDIEDVLSGLEVGADDYMKKPFDPRELVLRVKKLLNRETKISTKKYMFKNITIDTDKHLILEDQNEIPMSKKEYDLLLLLIKNKGLVLTRDKILDKVWQSNYYTGDRTVDMYISKIRDKVKSISKDIKTIKGVGYKLEEKIL
ncbi:MULTISPECIES: response regulator transcription factor [Psychrilyobacter]|uniref:Response regulator n=1 Tax=Psychrilyobacter piezotolerans TaxID=2293438 RepID=A0ABX9KIW2_9FUSO|nr:MULTISPECIES: response regulator transcription factor [Psychrilyobacter]MCS5422450.1 response regulator transcription factor [Psychrilyobacter sp. S5]NDI77405.1 response regulator transcription factor [Psychrilyobacter piezotolerans]RDE63709.1 DNA-binding response regulator [Psychrilyobacter sp. S5]REI42053.1 response regulator [Psychrilyobacter piezotolerans]